MLLRSYDRILYSKTITLTSAHLPPVDMAAASSVAGPCKNGFELWRKTIKACRYAMGPRDHIPGTIQLKNVKLLLQYVSSNALITAFNIRSV